MTVDKSDFNEMYSALEQAISFAKRMKHLRKAASPLFSSQLDLQSQYEVHAEHPEEFYFFRWFDFNLRIEYDSYHQYYIIYSSSRFEPRVLELYLPQAEISFRKSSKEYSVISYHFDRALLVFCSLVSCYVVRKYRGLMDSFENEQCLEFDFEL